MLLCQRQPSDGVTVTTCQVTRLVGPALVRYLEVLGISGLRLQKQIPGRKRSARNRSDGLARPLAHIGLKPKPCSF